MKLEQLFIDNFSKKGWISDSKATLLAVSGGVDSMVMAHLFLKAGLNFSVAHCNFQLRGEEANKDESLVKQWCDANDVHFLVNHFNTAEISKELKKGIQETARKLRYDWFQELCLQHGFKYIATAHHANDTVETLLINLFKGTGINGLQGIPEQNENIIRPLLFTTRETIAKYALEHHIIYREDASNKDDKYLRNAVRHNILPIIEEHFPKAGERMQDSIQRFIQAGVIYREAIDKKISKLVQQRGKDLYVPVFKLSKVSPLETICYELFKPYGFSGAQTQQLIDLMQAESGKYMLSDSHKLIKDRNFIIITALKADSTDFIEIQSLPGKIALDHITYHFSKVDKPATIPDAPFTAFIDASTISLPLILRRWRQGDYFYPLGMKLKKKKLSRFFIDQKIPVHEKGNIWVLECNKKILWVTGLRLDDRFKITDQTKEVLKVEMRVH